MSLSVSIRFSTPIVFLSLTYIDPVINETLNLRNDDTDMNADELSVVCFNM